MLLAHLTVGIIISLGITQRDLLVGIFYLTILNDLQVLIDFTVTLVRIDNDVKVVVVAKHLGQNTAERLFQHADKSGLVNVLEFFKLGKLLGHVDRFFSFSHNVLMSIFR